jgi:type I restriction enzyme S subunit
MSFIRYSDYFESDTPWSPLIPSSWKIKSTKRGFNRKKDLNLNLKCENRLSLTLNGVLRRSLDDLDGLQASEFETYQIFQKDDLVFKLIDLQNIKTSRVGIVHEEGIMSPAYIRLEPNQNIVFPKYAYWFFTDLYKREIFNKLGEGVRQTLGPEDLLALPFFYPPIEEQKKISSFLDYETNQIDELVSEQEKLIGLLKEKRQAVISNAVTKGLDKNVQMKHSGVEWLGQVPKHWEVKYLRHIAKIVRGASPRPAGDPIYFSKDDIDGSNTPWVTVAEITKDEEIYLRSVSEYLTPAGVAASQFFETGTLIFSNSGATLGVPKILDVNCCANDGVLAFKNLSNEINVEFLYFYLLTTTDRLRTEMKQGGGQPNLNTDIVKNIGLTLPPREEQDEVVTLLKNKLNEFSNLITSAETSVNLLQERRTALISAAVTGQVDVRKYKPKEVA